MNSTKTTNGKKLPPFGYKTRLLTVSSERWTGTGRHNVNSSGLRPRHNCSISRETVSRLGAMWFVYHDNIASRDGCSPTMASGKICRDHHGCSQSHVADSVTIASRSTAADKLKRYVRTKSTEQKASSACWPLNPSVHIHRWPGAVNQNVDTRLALPNVAGKSANFPPDFVTHVWEILMPVFCDGDTVGRDAE